MYYYSYMEPKRTLDNAISALKSEQKRLVKEIEDINKGEDFIKVYYERNKLLRSYFSYSDIIRELERLKEYKIERYNK